METSQTGKLREIVNNYTESGSNLRRAVHEYTKSGSEKGLREIVRRYF